jgi:hypothetical protein
MTTDTTAPAPGRPHAPSPDLCAAPACAPQLGQLRANPKDCLCHPVPSLGARDPTDCTGMGDNKQRRDSPAFSHAWMRDEPCSIDTWTPSTSRVISAARRGELENARRVERERRDGTRSDVRSMLAQRVGMREEGGLRRRSRLELVRFVFDFRKYSNFLSDWELSTAFSSLIPPSCSGQYHEHCWHAHQPRPPAPSPPSPSPTLPAALAPDAPPPPSPTLRRPPAPAPSPRSRRPTTPRPARVRGAVRPRAPPLDPAVRDSFPRTG